MYAEADLIPISALQHFVVCPRQCALIHLEAVWIEDARTAEGRVEHERVDRGGAETRGPVRRSGAAGSLGTRAAKPAPKRCSNFASAPTVQFSSGHQART